MQVQPIGVPAGAGRRVDAGFAVRVELEGVVEQRQSVVLEVEEPFLVEVACHCSARAVLRVVAVVLAAAVERAEREHDLDVGPGFGCGSSRPVSTTARQWVSPCSGESRRQPSAKTVDEVGVDHAVDRHPAVRA